MTESCPLQDPTATAPVLLVAVADSFFAEDLASSIREVFADARVEVVPDLEAAEIRLTQLPVLTAAFLNADPVAVIRSGLAARITAHGGRIVLMAHDPTVERAESWLFLPLPFTSASVRSVLGRLDLGRDPGVSHSAQPGVTPSAARSTRRTSPG